MEGECLPSSGQALARIYERAHQGTPFDLAIVDMHMPDMNGLRLAEVIKADPSIQSVRLLLCTPVGHKGEVAIVHAAEFSGYVTKPIRKDRLHVCLETVMGYSPSDPSAPDPNVTQFRTTKLEKLRKARVLIADDHQVNQQITRLMVERLGHKTDTVGSGTEVLRALEQIPYDLILMDCQMPEMDGYEATRAIRKAERGKLEVNSQEGGVRSQDLDLNTSDASHSSLFTPHCSHVPVIALTANAMQGDRDKCLQAGMDDYLSKPIRPEELARVLAKWLPHQQATSPSIAQEGAATLALLTPPAVSTDQSAINRQTLKELENLGGREFLQAMIQKFVEDALQCVTLIEQAFDAQNIHHLQEAAHGLKGIARNMGADSLAQIAIKIEADCQAGNTATMSEWSPRIQSTFQQTRQELEDVFRNA